MRDKEFLSAVFALWKTRKTGKSLHNIDARRNVDCTVLRRRREPFRASRMPLQTVSKS